VAGLVLCSGVFVRAAAPAFFIDPIDAVSITEEMTSRVEFDLHNPGATLEDLFLSASSSEQAVIPDSAMGFAGIGRNRALLLSPSRAGSTSITISLSDAQTHFQRSFKVTVLPRVTTASPMLLSAVITEKPFARIRLIFPSDKNANKYEVFRKDPRAASWGSAVALLPGTATEFADTNVVSGSGYEYRVIKNNSFPAFLYAGIRVPMIENRGTVVLLIDKTVASELAEPLTRLENDLVCDGWSVLRHDVNRTDDPRDIKQLLKRDYAKPAGVRTVFLFGHIPIAHSGWYAPDGHHQRAFPTDAFYADLDGRWTDEMGVDFQTVRPETRNFPGDGVYDQSRIPSEVELEIGRVDLFNMPAFLPRTEKELLRQYLEKDHRYRRKLSHVEPRGLADGWISGSLANQAAMFGPGNVALLPLIPTLKSEPFLFASRAQYGHYQGFNDGGGVTTDFARFAPKAMFYEFAGSYMGEWDIWDDFLRAPLCVPDYGLAASYSMPQWRYHHFALGETIGFCARLAQNNQNQTGLYSLGDVGEGMVHIALMGDPTLQLRVVAPVAQCAASVEGRNVRLRWEEPDDVVDGYLVYRSNSAHGPFSRLTAKPIQETTFVDPAIALGVSTYLVRAVKLESTASGTYENLSAGVPRTVLLGSEPDRTLPVVNISSPVPNQTLFPPVEFTATARDDRGISRVDFAVDSRAIGSAVEPPYKVAWDSRMASEGSHSVVVQAFDLNGNMARQSVSFTLGKKNTTPPAITLTAPASGQRVWGNVALRAATTGLSAIDRVEFRVDNELIASALARPYEALWRTFDSTTGKQTVPDGPHRIVATAYDRPGNRADASTAVSVDGALAAPTILMVSPERLVTEPGLVADLTYRWEGGPGLREWRVFVHLVDESGANFSLEEHAPPVPTEFWWGSYSYPVKFRVPRSLHTGLYQIMAGLYQGPTRVTLKPGPGVVPDNQQRYRVGTLSVLADATSPRISTPSLKTGQTVAGRVNVSVDAFDNVGVDRIELLINGKTYAVTNAIPNIAGKESANYDSISYRANFIWETAADPNGPRRVTLRAIDGSGNRGETAVDVLISNPTAYMAVPAELSARAGEKIALTYRWGGGPLRAAAQVTTEFMNETTRRAAFRVVHTPTPSSERWTGAAFEEPRQIEIPPNVPPGKYRIAVRLSYPGAAAGTPIPLQPGAGVSVTGKDLTARYYIGTLVVTP